MYLYQYRILAGAFLWTYNYLRQFQPGKHNTRFSLFSSQKAQLLKANFKSLCFCKKNWNLSCFNLSENWRNISDPLIMTFTILKLKTKVIYVYFIKQKPFRYSPLSVEILIIFSIINILLLPLFNMANIFINLLTQHVANKYNFWPILWPFCF